MRLAHLLIGKSIAESLLIGILAIAFFINAFPPFFRGFGEIEGQTLKGWATNTSRPNHRVELQLFVDGEFVTTGIANTFRPDVNVRGWAGDDWHGYEFPLVGFNAGRHEARVYALHTSGDGARHTLQLLGNPIDFMVDKAGVITSLSKRVEN